jgi:hypothetical protein
MFLGAYHFDGAPGPLLEGYDRLVAQFPPGVIELHVCVACDDGIIVLDACPDRETFTAFSQSPGFLMAVSGAGLPAPRVEALGVVHAAHVQDAASR